MLAALAAKIPDGLVRDVLCSQFDFSHHDDAQISRTLIAMRGAPALSIDFGVLSKVTADILPPGLFGKGR